MKLVFKSHQHPRVRAIRILRRGSTTIVSNDQNTSQRIRSECMQLLRVFLRESKQSSTPQSPQSPVAEPLPDSQPLDDDQAFVDDNQRNMCGQGLHELVMSKFAEDGYQGGWHCDRCAKSCNVGEERWFCEQCHYDVCFECLPRKRSNAKPLRRIRVRGVRRRDQKSPVQKSPERKPPVVPLPLLPVQNNKLTSPDSVLHSLGRKDNSKLQDMHVHVMSMLVHRFQNCVEQILKDKPWQSTAWQDENAINLPDSTCFDMLQMVNDAVNGYVDPERMANLAAYLVVLANCGTKRLRSLAMSMLQTSAWLSICQHDKFFAAQLASIPVPISNMFVDTPAVTQTDQPQKAGLPFGGDITAARMAGDRAALRVLFGKERAGTLVVEANQVIGVI